MLMSGSSRVLFSFILFCFSFFTPLECNFPHGTEVWDLGHNAICAYICERVDIDKQKAAAQAGAPQVAGEAGGVDMEPQRQHPCVAEREFSASRSPGAAAATRVSVQKISASRV